MKPVRSCFPRFSAWRFAALPASITRVLLVLCALIVASCLSQDTRIAGSSTEAGNAGGKLTLSDGRPAAGISVSLVAKNYLPDTLGKIGSGDLAGSYYRTHTGADGRFHFNEVAPGNYRVMAVDQSLGATADSVFVKPGGETILLDGVLKTLGGISGIAKVVGAAASAKVNIWVRPKSTLNHPPRADATGAFRLDSLPEGEYELVPQCFSCQPVAHGVSVTVKAGLVTVLGDTLRLYPEYFFGFPDSGDLVIRTNWIPVIIGGKINRGAEDRKNPVTVAWTWNGIPIQGKNLPTPDGISETSVLVDTGWFSGRSSGKLRLVLNYPDTAIMREWRLVLDSTDRIWPLSAVSAIGAVRIPGPVNRSVWRVHVTASRILDSSTSAFWGLWPSVPANALSIPEWVDLGADEAEMASLSGNDTAHFTFFLVPDRLMGGRIFRLRRDERIEDVDVIRFFERGRLGFLDSVEPFLSTDGLILDRRRNSQYLQRYRVDSTGEARELLGNPVNRSAEIGPVIDSPYFFFRTGPADAGYSWDMPLRDAAKALAVTREGLAVRLDGSKITVKLSDAEFNSLKRILAPLSNRNPAMVDTENLASKGTLRYLWVDGHGILNMSAETSPVASLVDSIHEWMIRNGIEPQVNYPLSQGTTRWLGFKEDDSTIRYTGDTLVLELTDTAFGKSALEYLSLGSPGRALDSISIRYFLAVEGDSLTVSSSTTSNSRLFGSVDERRGVYGLIGLNSVSAEIISGIPRLSGGGNLLSGILQVELNVHGRLLSRPAVLLDGRPLLEGRLGSGFLYSFDRGLERAWRFGGAVGTIQGWDLQ
jgi:hypothetical protein